MEEREPWGAGASDDERAPRSEGDDVPSRAPASLLIPCATVFVSSLCVMVIEWVAGRMIASELGASIYTWTSVIGIVMAGLAIGNYAGGLLADRFEVNRTLSALFIAASVASVAVFPVSGSRTIG